ncbi:MAG: hypothetical protein U9O94_05715, partial [Nanoarchaeota archaeon]|nr:hypothetical protein [Nanoarchaeota archaeon]
LTINGTGYTFAGLSFKWFSALDSNRVLDYTGTSMDSIAMLLVKSSNFTVTESNFLNVMGTAVYSKSANTNIVSNNFSYIGRDAIFIGDEAAPNTITPVYILQNNIERWGEYSASGRAITVYGDNVSIKDNTIKNGTSQAIQTAGNDTHNLTFNIFRNVIYNCGMPEGVKTDKYCLNDAGALYHNGLGVTGAVCNYLALQNVIFNVDGFKNVHGAYMDNGNNGISFKENLVFSCRTYSFYNRDESSTTKNSDVRDNILHGSYSCQDVSGGTFSNNFISARGGEAQNYLGGGITFVEYSGDLYSNSYTKENVLYVSNIENMRTNGLPVERYPINGYIKGIEYHSYNSNTSYNEINKAFIPNTLEKGTIINRGANGDSEFIKFSDGTLICGTYGLAVSPTNILSNQFGTTAGDVYSAESSIVFGHEFISAPIIVGNVPSGNALSIFYYSATTTGADYRVTSKTSAAITNISYIAVGRWK